MNHLKTFNELIRDFLTPKSKEDILKDLNKMSQKEKDNALMIASDNEMLDEINN